MAEIIIVSATAPEVQFLSEVKGHPYHKNHYTLRGPAKNNVEVLITGPGIVATTFHLASVLQKKKYDLAINLGICGSLDPDIKPVKLVNIVSDCFGDFGAENGNSFIDIFETGLINENDFPFKKGKLKSSFRKKLSCLSAISAVNAITVQKVHGSDESAARAYKKYGPVMESMEGAAFFYACLHQKIPCIQVRAVSNMVEKRNKKKWKITEAINALEGFTGLMLLELENL